MLLTLRTLSPAHAAVVLIFSMLAIGSTSRAAEPGYAAHPALFERTLVFASEGDLWTAALPEALGADPIVAFRLTTSDGTESHPVISPDGTRIAFAAQYDGNTDVYVMPIDGGAPTRLTFHPGDDEPLAWTPDGFTVLFRSGRAHPHGHDELWQVAGVGGMPRRFDFGECALATVSGTGRRFAFNPWSNENWTWKRYRGGTAPEIWVGDFSTGAYTPITEHDANDLFPMWMLGRVFFISDRTGTFNIHSVAPAGGDLRQHTAFAPDDTSPTAIEGYDVRWPSAAAERRGSRIVFCQGGGLAVYDGRADRVDRLDVRLASDRVAARRRFAPIVETAAEIALSPDGGTLLVGSRGEVVRVEMETGAVKQLTQTSNAREWGLRFIDDDQILCITDATGEQQIAMLPVDGSELPSLISNDREGWLFPPVGSPDQKWIAFAEESMRLNVIDLGPIVPHQVDRAEAGEIDDYRFSPDGQWLAYVKPQANGMSTIHLYALGTRRRFAVSDGRSIDREPRWDPAGRYLFFLSDRHFDPVMGRFDEDHVFQRTTQVYAVPLTTDTPPPTPAEMRAAGFDMEAWAGAASGGGRAAGGAGAGAGAGPNDEPIDPFAPPVDGGGGAAAPAGAGGGNDASTTMRLDTDDLPQRHVRLAVPPGNYSGLEAQRGALTFVGAPIAGLLSERAFDAGRGAGTGILHRFDLLEEELTDLARGVDHYVMSADGTTVAYPATDGEGVMVMPLGAPGDAEAIDLSEVTLRVDARTEWAQVLGEAWRLQRDFFWAPNFGGVDWSAMKEKYAALLPRIGSRAELNDVIGQMIGELGTSHTYVFGGQAHEHEDAEPVSVGMLGADIEYDGRAHRFARILPGAPWSDAMRSPLAAPHLGLDEGARLLAIDGQALAPGANVYELLQGRAGERVVLTVANEDGGGRRRIEVETLESEAPLRYLDWVERNRRLVEEATGGAVGYVHIPDMSGEGLAMFGRQFLPQYDKRGLIIDVRDNNGGFVSQQIIEHLSRRLLGFAQPRHGQTFRYPSRAPHAHMVVLIDQFAGSDGDIFPNAFRAAGLGPLIGTRTWGGVVGIRGDKPFVDMGLSTQPEFAWWDEGGWSIENEGVRPDIEVALTPTDRAEGRDPQLTRAIEHLQTKLAQNDKALPEVPPYPTDR